MWLFLNFYKNKSSHWYKMNKKHTTKKGMDESGMSALKVIGMVVVLVVMWWKREINGKTTVDYYLHGQLSLFDDHLSFF